MIAVFPGSFDPITKGHEDLIRRSSDIFDEVIVGVLNNNKKNALLHSSDRKKLIEQSVKDLKNVRVMVFDGLLVDFMRANNAKVIVRGIRNTTDLEYEMPLDYGNKALYADVETIYLLTNPIYSYISSSVVKELISYGADISKFVPEAVYNYFKNINRT